MTWFLPHNFNQKREILQQRMAITKKIRHFFDDQDFWEVETPILQACPTFDPHIHGYPAKDRYLRSSPELEMKKLMVAGVEKLYQIGPVFRDEPESTLHNPEFTMLEWYRTGTDYRTLIEDCQNLLRLTAKSYRFGDKTCDPNLKWNIISITELFDKYMNIDLENCLNDTKKFASHLVKNNVRTTPNDTWNDLFHAAMAEKIEPHLGIGAPTIIYDYPISMASLARAKPDDPRFAERMELYICGIELANGFSELTDPTEQRRRFNADMDQKQVLYGTSYPPDEEFFKALEAGMPESTGIALGLDRLIMSGIKQCRHRISCHREKRKNILKICDDIMHRHFPFRVGVAFSKCWHIPNQINNRNNYDCSKGIVRNNPKRNSKERANQDTNIARCNVFISLPYSENSDYNARHCAHHSRPSPRSRLSSILPRCPNAHNDPPDQPRKYMRSRITTPC